MKNPALIWTAFAVGALVLALIEARNAGACCKMRCPRRRRRCLRRNQWPVLWTLYATAGLTLAVMYASSVRRATRVVDMSKQIVAMSDVE